MSIPITKQKNLQPPLRFQLSKLDPKAGSVHGSEGMKSTPFWGFQFEKQHCFHIPELDGFTNPLLPTAPSPPPLTFTALSISAKPSGILIIFTCNPSKSSFAKSQWSLEVLVGDLQSFVVFRSNAFVLFLFLHLGFGGELNFQSDAELSVKHLVPKGYLGVFYEWHWKQPSWFNEMANDALSTDSSALAGLYLYILTDLGWKVRFKYCIKYFNRKVVMT